MPQCLLEKASKKTPQGYPLGSVANGPFSSSKSATFKAPSTPDFGPFVREQIVAQQDRPNPIGFSLPVGSKGRVWVASDRHGAKLIGDDRHWRVNVADLLKLKKEKRPATPWRPSAKTLRRPIIVVGRSDPVQDLDDALKSLKGFRIRICIDSEKELQVLGCGWRIVTCQFRGTKVLLHHNGNVATMKRRAFKALVAAARAIRPKRRPWLRLIVSNPNTFIAIAEAA
jgi:hypothetical protein